MKRLWCWQCKLEVPMLDDAEFVQVAQVHREAFARFKKVTDHWGAARCGDYPPARLRAVHAVDGLSRDERQRGAAPPAERPWAAVCPVRQALALARGPLLRGMRRR